MASPGREFTQPGLSFSDKRTRKPNSVLCGHSSRRRVAADVHQRPTRRFRALHAAALSSCACRSPLNASGRHAAPLGSGRTLPSLFGLAPCGVYPAAAITACAVRSYRTFSPLPTGRPGAALWACLSDAPRSLASEDRGCPMQWRYVFCGTGRPRAFKPASRTLSGTLPCGVRTFLSRKSQGAPEALQQRPPGPPASG